MDRIKELRDRKADLWNEATALTAKEDVKEGDGKITDEERERLNALTDEGGELDKVIAQIVREERLMDVRRSMDAAPSLNDDTEEEADDKISARVEKDPEKFKDLGEFLQAVARAGEQGGGRSEWDRRLHSLYQPGGIQAASGASESVPSEGGFLVQQDISDPMVLSMFQGGEILRRLRHLSISTNANGIVIPALDETSRANGSRWGGVQVFWADEADTVTGTKPKFRNMDLRLKKLFGIAYATEELLADAAMLERIFNDAFTEEITFKVEDGVINGTGAGQLLGLVNSGALISVAKESGQAAATVVTANILNMFNRIAPRSVTRCVWLVNQELLPQLQQLTLGSGTAVVRLFSIPDDRGDNLATGIGNLLGRPVIITEYNAALGTVGDIMLVDLDQYLLIDKGAVKQNSSIHVRFLFDEMTFRFIYRVDGQPMQRSAVSAFKGSATRSPYVALAARS